MRFGSIGCRAAAMFVIAYPCALTAQKADSAQPAHSRTGASPHSWTADDLLLSQDARTFRVSPDGRNVVWVQTAMSTAAGHVTSNLYMAPSRGGAPLQLTRGDHSVSAPRWSPDGKRVAFLSSLPLPDGAGSGGSHVASTQLWLIDVRGGAPWPVTKMERSIDDYAWKGSDTVIFIAQEDPSLYEHRTRERKDDSRVIDDSLHESPVRLFSLAVETQKIRRLSDNKDWIGDFALSPDGTNVVTVHARSLSEGYDQKIPSITRLTNLVTGASRVIFDGTRTIPYDITWASDGAGFYFVNDSTTSPRYRTATIAVLDYYDLASGRSIPVDHSVPRGVAGNLIATPDGLIANLGNGVLVQPVRYTMRRSAGNMAWTRAPLRGERADHSFDIDVSSDARTLVYRYTRANVPPQLYGATLDGVRISGDTQLTNLNPAFRNKPQPRTEIVHWNGARDEQVEGILTYPIGYTAGTRYPLVLTIHGGPALADLDEWKQSWSYPRILLNQKGAFTLQVNYHGSSRYGLHWVESICCGNIYDLETVDLERGVDYVVARGLADTARLGTLGHSYGAILSTQLTTVDQRFKAASAAAGDVEWFSDWGGVSFGASYDNYYFGASPWDNPELYVKKSPVFRFQNVRTPTIIYHGTDDRQVPFGQGWTYFRALQQLGKVPVRFVIFPGEPHIPRQYVHQLRKVEEDMAWFDRYLFGVPDSVNQSLDVRSPLAQAIKRAQVQQIDGRYGVRDAGHLVPEMVPFDGLALGRFEVTRAQFAEFDSSYHYPAGTANYPANGISFESAKRYTEWLARVTGQPYRLGTEPEMSAIYSAGGTSENTFDYWASYSANPDDAARLTTELERLKGTAPLLRPVGSFVGVGDDQLVFDLGGNVSEWAVRADGSGVLLGGSADQPVDVKVHRGEAAPQYRGLRVVRGPAAPAHR